MKTSVMTIRAMTLGLVLLSAGCSGSDATTPVDNGDVAKVTVRPAIVRGALNGFEGPVDTVAVIADVRDRRDNPMSDRAVTWQLRLSDGAQAGDSIATIASTGTQTASLVFHGHVMVVVVASVLGNDGVSRSGTLYVVPDL